MKSISVIIRSFNSQWVLDQCLASLFKQKGLNFELLLVDSGSTDKTLEQAATYDHRIFHIRKEAYFPGKVLNSIIKEAKYEEVVFINSDVVLLDEYALLKLIEPLEDKLIAATFGRQITRPEAWPWVKKDYEISFPPNPYGVPWISYSLPLASLKKSVWKHLPFYTQAWGSEDTKWGVDAKALGYKVVYVPEALAMHSHNYTLKQLSSRMLIEGEADFFIYAHKIPSAAHLFLQALKHFLKDSIYLCKNHQFSYLGKSLLPRLLSAYFYYKGYKQSQNRMIKNTELSYGSYQ